MLAHRQPCQNVLPFSSFASHKKLFATYFTVNRHMPHLGHQGLMMMT